MPKSKVLEALSMARAWQYAAGRVKGKDGKPEGFAQLSAYRSRENDPELAATNVARFKDLKKTLRSQGYGFHQTVGAWQGGAEKSLLVPGMSLAHAHEHSKQHNQDSFIYSGHETKHVPHIYNASRHPETQRVMGYEKGDALGHFRPGEGPYGHTVVGKKPTKDSDPVQPAVRKAKTGRVPPTDNRSYHLSAEDRGVRLRDAIAVLEQLWRSM